MSAEATGQVRLARAAIDAKHRSVIRAFGCLPESVGFGIGYKRNAGFQRALDRLLSAMPIPPYAIYDRVVVYRTLRCTHAPLANDNHDFVEVAALAIGAPDGMPTHRDAPWGLLVSSHAMGRLWERAHPHLQDPSVDFASAILGAHDTLLECPYEVFAAARNGEDARWILPVPAADGGFLCKVSLVTHQYDGDTIPIIQALTFLSTSQFYPDQDAQAAAARFRPSVNPIGKGVMLPPQLRAHAPRDENGMASLPITSKLAGPRKNVRLPKVELSHTVNNQQLHTNLC